jgi:4'-phosphopantetheinyl transferase
MMRPADAGVVHLWPVHLEDPAWDRHAGTLSDAERGRAARLLRPADACRFVRGHVALRAVLGRYLDCAPEAVAFTAGPYGKPGVAGDTLQFNFSHSDELAVVAVAGCVVGVDVEYSARALPELDGMMALTCHPMERAALRALAADERIAAFYRIWTRKEAYCKALGVGLRRDLTAIRFVADGEDTCRVIDDAELHADGFYVSSRTLAPSCMAAVCTPVPALCELFHL